VQVHNPVLTPAGSGSGYQPIAPQQYFLMGGVPGAKLHHVLGTGTGGKHHTGESFIGGSLIAHGGHNPLEALHAGIPVTFGASMYNFQHIRDRLVREPFARELADNRPETLAAALLALHAAPHSAAIRACMSGYENIVAAHLRHLEDHIK